MLANIITDLVQRSPEWIEMRKGMVTGSMVGDAIDKMKTQPKEGPTKYKQCRENYMLDLAGTRLSGNMPQRYVNRAMEIGIDREPLAIQAYEMKFDVMVESVGFAFHPRINWYGSSPDGLVGSDIVLEAKCPTEATHIRYLCDFKKARDKGLQYVPEDYLPQVKAHLACTERPVCHFISFHPDFPEHLQLLVSPWDRDKQMIDEQDAEVEKFLADLDALMIEIEQAVA